MIFGIGLPRCAGQTLGDVIRILTGGVVYHSIEGHRWDVVDESVVAAVETYAPYAWLERHWPGSLFIANHRGPLQWHASCEKVYHKAREGKWNHPMWQYPPTSWLDYYNEYWDRVSDQFPQDRVYYWDITASPTWDGVCKFLGFPVPNVPFPNRDVHGRTQTQGAELLFPSPW